MSLTPNTKDTLQKALDDNSKGMLGKWKGILDVLLSSNAAFKSKLPVSSLLVHPQNRGGSGVQPFHMHQKGAKIVQCGASLDQLIGSVCFEMQPEESKKGKQVKFNEDLAGASSGLMAPVQGGERYLTVSSSHTSQFCRAVAHGCKTPEPTLKDSNGNLSLEMLGKDKILREMVEVGWDWIVIPWYIEEAFPSLPAMVADALNSVNGIFEAQGELELALTIANAATGGSSFDWDQLASSCCTSPQVAGYARYIGKLVKNLGGGKDKGYPLIKFAQEFQKQFGNSCFVGKDCFSSLLDTEIVPTNMTVFVKIAILATQVSCPESKRIDNFSRFVTKGDIQMLKGKKYQGKVADAEKMLSQCWDNMQANPMATFEKNKVFGRLCLRTTLHLLSKEKSGRDTTEFANLQEIQGAFTDDLKALPQLQPQALQMPSPSTKQDAVSLVDGQSPLIMANLKVPLKVGHAYCHKDHSSKIFIMDSKDDTYVYLSSQDLVSGHKTALKLEGSEIMEKLKGTKQKDGFVIGGDALAKTFPSVTCQDEVMRSNIFQGLFQLYEDKDTDESFIKFVSVPGKGLKVFALQPIKKHDLILVPMCDQVAAIQFSEPKGKLWASGKWDGRMFWILPPKVAKEPTDSTVVPYFHMKEIEDGQMSPFQLDSGKLKVLGLRNTTAIQKHEEIGLVMDADKQPPAKKKRT